MKYSISELDTLAGLAEHVGARLELADAAHGVLTHVLAIKANPPTYNAVVSNMADIMAAEFGMATSPAVVKAAAEIGGYADDPSLTGPQRQGKARERVGALQKELEALGTEVDADLGKDVGRYLAVSYRLGLAETTKPLGWNVDFTMADRDAIHGLHNSGVYWIGAHYGDALGEMPALLAEVDKVMLTGGLGRREGGRAVAKLIGGKIQRSDAYWTGFAGTVATRSRSMGALSGMSAVGATRYEFVNPLDERTSDVCAHLDGTLFTVKGGLALRDKLLGAKTPEEWKAISPWPKAKDLLGPDGTLKKPGELQAAGIAWPPLHFFCRSTIEVRIWTPLGEGDLDPLGDVDPYAVKPPKKAPAPIALPDVVPEPVLPPPWEPDLPPGSYGGNPTDEDWRILFRLQGYTDAELDEMLADVDGIIPLPNDLMQAVFADDVQAITKLLAKRPPITPRVFPADLIPAEGTWLEVGEGTPWAIQDVDEWLFKKGYTKADLEVLWRTNADGTELLPTNVLSPAMSRWRVAKFLDEHPPGSPQLAALVEAKVAEALAAEQAAAAAAAAAEAHAAAVAAAAAEAEAAAQAAAAAAAKAAAKAAAAAKKAAAQAAADKAAAQAAQAAAEAAAQVAAAEAAAQAAAQAAAAQAAADAAAQAAQAAMGGPGAWLPELAEGAAELKGAKFKKWLAVRGYTAAELDEIAPVFESYAAAMARLANTTVPVGDRHGIAWGQVSRFLRARPPAKLKTPAIPWQVGEAFDGYPQVYNKPSLRGWLIAQGYSKEEANDLVSVGLPANAYYEGSNAAWMAKAQPSTPHGHAGLRYYVSKHPPKALGDAPIYDLPNPTVGLTPSSVAATSPVAVAAPVAAPAPAPTGLAKVLEAEFTPTDVGPPKSVVLGTKTGGAAGSNEGGFYTGTDGVKRYVKFYSKPVQAEGENLANGIYRALGLGAPKSGVIKDGDKLIYWSEILDGKTLGATGLTKDNAQAFMDGFVVDVLTANWDSAGLSLDNALITTGGKLVRIDNGGSLLLRAQGTAKPASVLNKIDEWDAFFDKDKNPSYAKVAAAAGYKSADDFLPVISAKVDEIVALRDGAGGWAPLVEKMAPNATAAERKAMAEMLEARTTLLQAKVAKVPKAAPVPKPVPAPAPGTVPPVPAVHASAVPKGAVDVHAGYGWQPIAPGPESAQWGGPETDLFLAAQGYSKAEIKELRADFLSVLVHASADANKLGVAKGTITPGRIVTFLEAKPPGSVVSTSVKPGAFLSPAELGTRLVSRGPVPGKDLGELFEDQLTAEKWQVRFHADADQARSQTVASMIYRQLGIEAPPSRIVSIDGKVGVATRQWTGWGEPISGDLEKHGEQLAREMPADAFLGNWNVAGTDGRRILVRDNPIPGTSSVLRSNNDGVLAWRSTGTQKGAAWTGSDVTEMDTFLDPSKAPVAAKVFSQAAADRGLMLPMMDRIGTLTDADIARAVQAGGFDPAGAKALEATLRGRRDAMATRAKALRADIKRESDERVAAAARAEAARKVREARRAVSGVVTVRRPRLGVDLRAAAAEMADGPVSIAGDHGYVRHQQVTAQRYRMEHGGKVQHEGVMVRMQIDEAHWADVEAGLQAKGGRAGSFRSWQRVGFSTKADTAGEPILRMSATNESGSLGSAFTLSTPEVEIDYAGSVGLQAMKGELRILIKATDPAAAQAVLERTMRELRVEAALQAPSEDAAFLAGANRVLWNLRGKTHKRITDRAKAAKELAGEGVDVRAIEKASRGGRGYQSIEIAGRGQKWRKKGARFLYNAFRMDDTVVSSLVGADGSAGGLLSTVERSMHGIVVAGMSSTTDLSTGGAVSVFTRLVGKGGSATQRWYTGPEGPKALIDPRVLDRTDWYGWNEDRYGATTGTRYSAWTGAEKALEELTDRGESSNEIMFRHEVDASSILGIAVGNAGEKAQILGWLKARGVTTVRGRPADEFVIVMRTPQDYSGFKADNPNHQYLLGKTDDAEDWEPVK